MGGFFMKQKSPVKNFKEQSVPEARINDLIFKELIKRGYSLEGNTRVWNIADSKLWYLIPEQAQAYLDLDHDEEYKKKTGQLQGEKLIKNNISDILEWIGDEPINIIDLGCGDGEKAAVIVQEIRKIKPELKLRYCPIDISGYMVQKAIDTFLNLDVEEIIEFQYNISDFENLENITPLLKKNSFKKNLILLLGNTLGNFEINELLYEVRSGMDKGDLFLVDTAVNDNMQEERTESYKNNHFFNEWLYYVMTQLGLERDEIEFGVRWRNSRLEFYYTILKDKNVKFQNKSVQFNKGDQIVVVIAYKHEKDDLISYFNIYFDNVLFRASESGGKVLALCEK